MYELMSSPKPIRWQSQDFPSLPIIGQALNAGLFHVIRDFAKDIGKLIHTKRVYGLVLEAVVAVGIAVQGG